MEKLSKDYIKKVFRGDDKTLMKKVEREMRKSGLLLKGEFVTEGVDY